MTNTQSAVEVIESPQVVKIYGERDDVREITARLMAMHPMAQQVGEPGMRAVAQLAMLCGANPLPTVGEIYVWPGSNGQPVVELGIAYYRRKANEIDSVMWQPKFGEPRPMTTEERTYYGIPDGSLAAICKGFRLSRYEQVLATGTPWQQTQEMLLRTSWAVVDASELVYQRDTRYRKKGEPTDPPNGRTWQWVAEKRAEKGIYRILSLVDTQFAESMAAKTQEVLSTFDTPYALVPGINNNQAKSWRTDVAPEEIDDWFSYG